VQAVSVVPAVVVPAVPPVLPSALPTPTPTAPPTATPTATPSRVVVLPPASAVGAHGIGLPGAGLPGLGLGRHGDPVSVLQRLLRLAGADLGTERGTFGPRTKAALAGLVPSSHGRVDDAIVDALLVKVGRRFAPVAPGRGETLGLPTLIRGSRGADVVLCQSILVRLGFRPGPVDGAFGPRTRAAVQAYQRSRHLLADGVVGRQTWSALLSLR
jgi:peptidoglycan hydrolase-like protein with peptidoglycan-binding domain